VVVGYNYQPLVPIPWFQGAGLTTTSAETQLELEQGLTGARSRLGVSARR
jgi:hypothetical protein